MAMFGWVIYNGFLQGNKFLDFAEMLQQAGKERGHEIILKKNDEITNYLNKQSFLQMNKPLPDYVLFTDKDIYLASTLERANIRVFNRARAIEQSDDKIKTYERLIEANIPIPETIIAPKTFGMHINIDTPILQHTIKQLQFPFIVKESFGSFGEQVYLVHNEKELVDCLSIIGGAPFVLQQFISTSYGMDLRLQVVGNEVVAAMKRTSATDFRANVTTGGKMEPYKPNKYEAQLAIQATKAIGADFAGVDLLLGKDNERYVCEVNSNAHIRNLYESTNINVAPYIIEHIERQLKRK